MNTVNACPFCGLVTGEPHETQEACIEALHAEIDRTRELLEHVPARFPEAGEPTSDTPAARPNR
jgi:hypothetical protein